MRGHRRVQRLGWRHSAQAGVTLPELMVALAVTAIAAAVSLGFFFQYQESISATRAARMISADIQIARGLAIRGRTPVSLVATEAQQAYVVRDTFGNVFHQRRFGSGSDIQLTSLDVTTAGDSITFDGRGVVLASGTPVINAVRRNKSRSVTLNALGRTQVN